MLLLALSPAARAANQTVTDLGDGGLSGQLRQKLTDCLNGGGGTITFAQGLSGQITLMRGSLPTITGNAGIQVTIDGGGVIEISGNNSNNNGVRIFNVNAGATLTLRNLTLSHAFADGDGGAVASTGALNAVNVNFFNNIVTASWSGSAILCWGPLTITNCEFGFNSGGGGAVKPRSSGASTTITGSYFHDNQSNGSAGGGYGGAMQLHDAPSVTVDQCDFENNEAGTSGGAIHVNVNSALTLTNSTIISNRADTATGGGLDIRGSAFISNTQITSNKAPVAGGGINSEVGAQVEIVNSTISGNTALDYTLNDPNSVSDAIGGGIRSLGALTVKGSTIQDNVANVARDSAIGGGIYHANGALTLTNVTIQGNQTRHGAGIYMGSGTATMKGVKFTSNYANLIPGSGGGLFVQSGTASLTNVTFTNNAAGNGGGGIHNFGNLTVLNSAFTGNFASYLGGGIINGGTMTLTNSTVNANKTEANGAGFGGGISNSGTLTLNSTTVRDNYANYDGGGIANSGSVTLNTSTVTNNTANAGDGVEKAFGGGGIFNSNGTTLNRSTVSGNKTNKLDGGGLYNYHGAVFVGSSTFSGNTAAGWGGGIISDYGQTILNHATLSGNSAVAGGGIYNLTADSTRTIVMQSTIIANSPSGYNCAQFSGSQDVQSNGYNLSDDNSFNTFCTGAFQAFDVSNANVKLGPLANNGGFTLTHLPQPDSPAIDAIPSGQNGCGNVDPDQRGISRPQAATCDIGAVEYLPLVENGSLFVQYDGWHGFTNASANGGAYRMSNVANDTVTYTFSGTSIKWITTKAANMGKALVTIDGISAGTFDLYSASTLWNQQIVFGNLSSGSHKIVIKVLGTKNASSTGFNVALDGFLVGSATKAVQETALAMQYNSWIAKTQTLASGNSYASSDTFGTTTLFRFRGTSINFVTARGPTYGAADIYIDGVLKSSNVDLYSATQQYQYWLNYSGLTNANHTIEVRPTHSKNAKSKGFSVVVDSFTGPFTALP